MFLFNEWIFSKQLKNVALDQLDGDLINWLCNATQFTINILLDMIYIDFYCISGIQEDLKSQEPTGNMR